MEHRINGSLIALVESSYGVRVRDVSPLSPGIESWAWRIETDSEPVVLMVYPRWRTAEELTWVHRLIAEVSRTVPEAVAPLAMPAGNTLLHHDSRLVSLFPFVSGQILDRDDPLQRLAAARLLARLHRAMCGLEGLPPRPVSWPDAPQRRPRPPDPPELLDRELDALCRDLERENLLKTGPIHGDYYRGNVLCRDGHIVGVIDWNEARVAWLIRELAWCTWEFAKSPSDDSLLLDRAQGFLEAYTVEGGPVPQDEHHLLIPFIRVRLREEMRLFLAAAARGEPWWDRSYFESEVRAFAALRGHDQAGQCEW